METVNVEENRRRFIHALRTNPHNLIQQHTCTLYNKETGAVCALGLGCVEFGINMSIYDYDPETDLEEVDPYGEIKDRLDMDHALMSRIWTMNDSDMLSFSQIADHLEEVWFPATIEAGDLTEIR